MSKNSENCRRSEMVKGIAAFIGREPPCRDQFYFILPSMSSYPAKAGYPVSRGARAELRGRGVLDHPLSRMMTAQPTAMALPSFAPSTITRHAREPPRSLRQESK